MEAIASTDKQADEPRVNSSGNSPQDYTQEYVECRKHRRSKQGKEIFEQFGLTRDTAQRLDLGVSCEMMGKKKVYRIIYPVSKSFYIRIAPAPLISVDKRDVSIQYSFGGTVEPCNLGVFDSKPDCVFVTTDVRDLLAIEQLGFRAVSLNNNNTACQKKLMKKLMETEYCGTLGLFYSSEKTRDKMEELKNALSLHTSLSGIKTELFSLYNEEESFYENLKKDPEGLKESLEDFWKANVREVFDCELVVRTRPTEITRPTITGELQPYEDAFEALPDHSFASEHDEMAKLIEFIEEVLPEPHLFIRVPNELARDHQEGWKFKEEGLRAGVPDYFYAFPCGRYSGLWIEMKREDGGEVSHAQQQYLNLLSKMNYMTAVCHGVEEAKKAIIKYLANRE